MRPATGSVAWAAVDACGCCAAVRQDVERGADSVAAAVRRTRPSSARLSLGLAAASPSGAPLHAWVSLVSGHLESLELGALVHIQKQCFSYRMQVAVGPIAVITRSLGWAHAASKCGMVTQPGSKPYPRIYALPTERIPTVTDTGASHRPFLCR